MNTNCLVVRSKQQNDARFRPGTPTPDKHWAYMLLDSYAEYDPDTCRTKYPEGISIDWSEENDTICIKMTSELWKNDEICFEHLMSFIKMHELTYEFPCDMEECTKCEGHPSCISNEHAMSDIRISYADTIACQNAA